MSRAKELTIGERMEIIKEKSKPNASIRSVAVSMSNKLGRKITKKQVENTWNRRKEISEMCESNISAKRRRIESQSTSNEQCIRRQVNEHVHTFF